VWQFGAVEEAQAGRRFDAASPVSWPGAKLSDGGHPLEKGDALVGGCAGQDTQLETIDCVR
jgi:hypothetical protein